MGESEEKVIVPTFEQTQSFFNAEYPFLKKWMAVKEPNWEDVITESRQIEAQFPFQYCRERIVLTVELIEQSYMERSNDNG